MAKKSSNWGTWRLVTKICNCLNVHFTAISSHFFCQLHEYLPQKLKFRRSFWGAEWCWYFQKIWHKCKKVQKCKKHFKFFTKWKKGKIFAFCVITLEPIKIRPVHHLKMIVLVLDCLNFNLKTFFEIVKSGNFHIVSALWHFFTS